MSHIKLDGPFTRHRAKTHSENWHNLRHTVIGGSEAGAIMGASGYASPLTIWAEKTGAYTPPDISDKPAIRRGRFGEPMARKFFREDFGKFDDRAMRITHYPFFMRSTANPFMGANIDGLIELEGMPGTGVVEIKTTETKYTPIAKSWFAGEIYEPHYWQMLHYMIVTGLKWGMYILAIGDYIYWDVIEYNADRAAELIDAERDLWQMVQDRTAPAPIGIDSELEVRRAIDGPLSDDKVELDDSAGSLILELADLESKKKELEQEIKRVKLMLREKLHGHAMGTVGDHYVKISMVTTNRFDGTRFKTERPEVWKQFVKTSSYERMTIR